ADPRGDTGNDAERDAGLGQRQCLLAAAAEHAGIAALKPQYALAFACDCNQPGGNVGLARRPPAAALARVFQRRAGLGQRQDAPVDQRVIDDAVRAVEGVLRKSRKEDWSAGRRPDQPDAAGHEFWERETRAVDHARKLYQAQVRRVDSRGNRPARLREPPCAGPLEAVSTSITTDP